MNDFSIYHIFRLLIKNFFIILLCAIICGVGAFCCCKFYLQERYAASGSLVVTNGGILSTGVQNPQYIEGEKINNSDIAASINLLTTVKDILSDGDIYKQLAAKLDGKYTYTQLKGFASVKIRDELSLLIDVRFEMADKDEAIRITNMFLELTPEYINEIIPNSSTKIVTTADKAAKTYPRTIQTTLLSMIIGAVISFVVVYVISLFNTTIESEEEFKERYNVPVLGDIPDFATAKSGKYAKSYYKGGNYYGN